MNNEYIKEWESAVQAAKELGLRRREIAYCCEDKTNYSQGSKRMFKDKYLAYQKSL